jgi:hypothetical protein
MRESHWILQENTGNIWNMEAVFPPGISRFFPMISGRILPESTRICRNPFPAVRHSPGSVLLITMLYLINVKCAGLVIRLIRSDNQMDDISIAEISILY